MEKRRSRCTTTAVPTRRSSSPWVFHRRRSRSRKSLRILVQIHILTLSLLSAFRPKWRLRSRLHRPAQASSRSSRPQRRRRLRSLPRRSPLLRCFLSFLPTRHRPRRTSGSASPSRWTRRGSRSCARRRSPEGERSSLSRRAGRETSSRRISGVFEIHQISPLDQVLQQFAPKLECILLFPTFIAARRRRTRNFISQGLTLKGKSLCPRTVYG